MKRLWMAVATLSAVGLASIASAGDMSSPELGAAYSFVQNPEYSGFGVSWGRAHDRDVDLVVTAANYFIDGYTVQFLAVGQQFRFHGESARLFGQILFGIAGVGFHGIGLVIYPGAGLDIGPRHRVGARLEVDWPLALIGGGGAGVVSVPRFSAGIVFRPNVRGTAPPSTRAQPTAVRPGCSRIAASDTTRILPWRR